MKHTQFSSTGNVTVLVALLAAGVLIGGGLWWSSQQGEAGTSVGIEREGQAETGGLEGVKEAENVAGRGQDTEETADEQGQASQRYIPYSDAAFAANLDKKRVYFFHASWCPTCKVAHTDITENTFEIPEDVVVFKTDYDTSVELKKQYNVTYQHTFVQVDGAGNEVSTWNGGGVEQLQREVM
jgi:thiol-disulfide isomerase/thioredoxin